MMPHWKDAFIAATIAQLSLGFVYVYIGLFQDSSYILPYLMAFALALAIAVAYVKRRENGENIKDEDSHTNETFYRILHQQEFVNNAYNREMVAYKYFCICMERGEQPGKRNWYDRSDDNKPPRRVPAHPNIIFTKAMWQHVTRRALKEGVIMDGGRGVGYKNIVRTSQ